MIKTLCLSVCALSQAAVIQASEEDMLTIKSFQLETYAYPYFGTIEVSGSRDEAGRINALSVYIDGAETVIPDEIRDRIPSYAELVQISVEMGYRDTGGPTVNISFMDSFYHQISACPTR